MNWDLGSSLELFLYVAAAKADANPEQAALLKAQGSDKINEFLVHDDVDGFKDWIRSVMGSDWQPAGQAKMAIDSINKTK